MEKCYEGIAVKETLEKQSSKYSRTGEHIGLFIYQYSFRYHEGQIFQSGDIEFEYDKVSPKEVMGASFVIFVEEQENFVEDIFRCSSRLTHKGILRPIFTIFCEQIKKWIVCYPRFNTIGEKHLPALLKSYNYTDSRGEAAITCYMDDCWRKTARDGFMALQYAQDLGIIYGNLEDCDNFVVVDDELKMINFSLDMTDERFNFSVDKKRRDNILTFKKFMGCFNTDKHDAEWREFNRFVKWRQVEISQIINHPFLKTSEERFDSYCDIYRRIEDIPEVRNMRNIKSDINGKVEFKNWRRQFGDNRALFKPFLNPNLNPNLRHVAPYDQNRPYDLLRFLRNFSIHGGKNMNKVDKDGIIMTTYRGFLGGWFNALVMESKISFDIN